MVLKLWYYLYISRDIDIPEGNLFAFLHSGNPICSGRSVLTCVPKIFLSYGLNDVDQPGSTGALMSSVKGHTL